MKNNYALLALLIAGGLSAMEVQQKMEYSEKNEDSFCYLAWLPLDILDYIASFLELSTETYETEQAFKNRLVAAENMAFRTESKKIADLKISESQTLHLTDGPEGADLELVSTTGEIKKLIQSNALQVKGEKKPNYENLVCCCAISSSKQKVVALVDNFKLHTIDVKQPDSAEVFSLENYFAHEGFVGEPEESKEVEERYRIHGYFRSVAGGAEPGCFFLYSSKESEEGKWYKRVGALAVANNGQLIAFSNNHQLFLVDLLMPEKSYKLMYESSVKPVGPFDDGGNKKFFKPFAMQSIKNIASIEFNNQSTFLGVVFEAMSEGVPDKVGLDMAYNDFIKIVHQNAYFQQKHLFSTEEQKRIEQFFLKGEPKEIDPLVFYILNIEKKLYDAPKEMLKRRVILIRIKEDKPSLQTYFAKRGVCKGLKKQLENFSAR